MLPPRFFSPLGLRGNLRLFIANHRLIIYNVTIVPCFDRYDNNARDEPMSNDVDKKILELEKMLALHREILDNISEGVHIIDADGAIVWANQTILREEGNSKGGIIGQKENDVWPGMIPAGFNRFTDNADSSHVEIVFSFFNTQGKKMDILSRSFPFRFLEKLEYVFSIGTNTDYSDRQIAKILESRKKLLLKSKGKLANGTSFALSDFMGQNDKVLDLLDIAKKIAVKSSPVLICGQTGTGKEIIAQGIHNASFHQEGKFVAVNCAAIPETLLETTIFGSSKGAFTGAVDRKGLLEEAAGGTLFLDEINSLPLALQGKLLRVLQEKRFTRVGSNTLADVTCRFISATNQAPWQLVEDGVLRKDLYFRLCVVSLTIPPLSARKDDIPLLVKHIIKRFNAEYHMEIKGVSQSCADIFEKYAWPGNVRELEHVIEYMMNVTTETFILSNNDLPPYLLSLRDNQKTNYEQYLNNESSLAQIMEDFERNLLVAALNKNQNNISKTARELSVRRETLHYRIKKLGISIKD